MTSSICKYFPCPVAEKSGRDCSLYETCGTKRFYDKFGVNYRENILGDRSEGVEDELKIRIGAMVVSDVFK